MDDLLIFSNNKNLKDSMIRKLEKKFKTRNLGPVPRILGINIERGRKRRCIMLKQKDYVEETMKKYNMEDCKPVKTPLDGNQKLSKNTESCRNTSVAKEFPYKKMLGKI